MDSFQPNAQALQQLRDLGIPDNAAFRGLLHTGNVDANRAAEWCFENLDDPGFDLPVTNDEVKAVLNAAGANALPNAPYGLRFRDEPVVKLVFVVNSGLKMGVGIAASQVSHASIDICKNLQQANHELFGAWMSNGGKTVVLRGKNDAQLKSLLEKARSANLTVTAMHDSELTKAPDSLTVFGLFGEEAKVNAVTGELPLL